MTGLVRRLLKFMLLIVGMNFFPACAQAPPVDSSSLTTSDRLEEQGWWPTKGDADRKLYAGSAACATCHRTIAALQQTTPMYHAGARATQSEILAAHDQLKFQEGGLTYSLNRTAA